MKETTPLIESNSKKQGKLHGSFCGNWQIWFQLVLFGISVAWTIFNNYTTPIFASISLESGNIAYNGLWSGKLLGSLLAIWVGQFQQEQLFLFCLISTVSSVAFTLFALFFNLHSCIWICLFLCGLFMALQYPSIFTLMRNWSSSDHEFEKTCTLYTIGSAIQAFATTIFFNFYKQPFFIFTLLFIILCICILLFYGLVSQCSPLELSHRKQSQTCSQNQTANPFRLMLTLLFLCPMYHVVATSVYFPIALAYGTSVTQIQATFPGRNFNFIFDWWLIGSLIFGPTLKFLIDTFNVPSHHILTILCAFAANTCLWFVVPFFSGYYLLFSIGYFLTGALVQQYWLALPFVLGKMDTMQLSLAGKCHFTEQSVINVGVGFVQILQCIGPVIVGLLPTGWKVSHIFVGVMILHIALFSYFSFRKEPFYFKKNEMSKI